VKISALVEELNEIAPGFDAVWSGWLKEDEEYGDGDKPSVHDIFLEFNNFIISLLDSLSLQTKSKLFVYIENALTSADETLNNAVATCFLESLVQKSLQYKPENAFPFLGPESKAYCKAWEEFNGMKTEGLW